MDLKLAGLNAVITGGTAGIGAAIVKHLAAEGCNVAFCSRSSEKVAAMRNALSEHSVIVQGAALDVSNADDFSAWVKELGPIDIFIPSVTAISPDFGPSISIDIGATVSGVEAVLPYLKQSSHGAITYMGSLGASFALPAAKGYGAAKAAMVHYMKSLSRELATDGIRVNVVSPGSTYVEDGFWGNMKRHAPQMYEATVMENPLGRLADVDEIARVVTFISSPAASFVSGANWFVDGACTVHVHG